jgi:hypothetical protein
MRRLEFDSGREHDQQDRMRAVVADVKVNQEVKAIVKATGDKRERPKAVKAAKYKRRMN